MCANTFNAAGPGSGVSGAPTAGELSPSIQVAIGTLKLDETENAVTAEQAQELVPLWETLQVLSESDTAAQQEQGLALGGGPTGGQNNSAPGRNQNGGGGFGPGGFPGGGPGGGGGQGSGLTPDQIATVQASRQQTGGVLVPPMLINALIEYLQEKAGA